MLQEVLDYIHNYFVKEVYKGKFRIISGSLDVDFLQSDQYFKIVGSVFNDGVHKYSDADVLTDEEFQGEVWAMAVPKAILDVAVEITAWVTQNKEAIESPFQSESFGGYSYTKASGKGASGSTGVTWQDKFGHKLNAYRKIS